MDYTNAVNLTATERAILREFANREANRLQRAKYRAEERAAKLANDVSKRLTLADKLW